MFEMIHPQYEFISIDTPLKDFYTPIYPSTEGLSQKLLLKLVQKVFDQESLEVQYPDYFGNLYQEKNLPSLLEALRLIHQPHKKYEKKYGIKRTLVLMQIGSFHEAYATEELGPDLRHLSSLLNILIMTTFVFSGKYCQFHK